MGASPQNKALERLGIGLLTLHPDGQILHASPRAASLLGGVSAFPAQAASLQMVLQGEGPHTFSAQVGTRWLQIDARLEGGTLEGLVADQTASRRAAHLQDVADAARTRSDRLRRIAEMVPGVVMEWSWRAGGDATLTFLNTGQWVLDAPLQTLESALGWVHADEREAVREAMSAARRSLAPFDLRVRLHPPGEPSSTRWFQLRGTAESVAGGGRVCAILIDINRHIKVVTSLQEAQEGEAVTELLTGVVHHLHRLLDTIRPGLEGALPWVPPTEQGPLLGASRAAQSAEELLGRLLRIVGDGSGDEVEELDLVELVRDAVQVARSTITLPVIVAAAPAACWIRGHGRQLRRLLLDLLLSARDALAETAQPEIRIALQGTGGCWAVTIEDNGPGMDARTLRQIGDPSSTSHAGVAAALRVARAHGGTLRWGSALGAGSWYRLELPQSTPSQPQAPRPDTHPLAGVRILLVDDDDLVRRVLGRMMRRRGLDVILAASGEEGLALFEAERETLDAVLLDLSLPRLSGEEVLDRMRVIDPSVPVIIASGLPPGVDLEGVFATITKPVSGEVLFGHLSRATQSLPS